MTILFKTKKNAFIAGVMMMLCASTTWGSSSVPDFDVGVDVKVLAQCFNGEHGEPVEEQYKLEARRYVRFDVSSKCDDVSTSLLPLGTDEPLGQRAFHGRNYEVAGTKEVGPSVLAGLQMKGSKMFVRSSSAEFDAEYWALYELLIPVVPEPVVADEADKVFELPDGGSIRLSDLPTLHDEVGEGVFTQHFFAIFYRELKG